MKENEPIVGEVEVVVVGPGILTREQGTARSAFTDFCWDLQLATARSPDDPGLSMTAAEKVRTMFETNHSDTAATGHQLWQAWIATDGHAICPAIFKRRHMDRLLVRLQVEQSRYRQTMALRQEIAGKIPVALEGVE